MTLVMAHPDIQQTKTKHSKNIFYLIVKERLVEAAVCKIIHLSWSGLWWIHSLSWEQ